MSERGSSKMLSGRTLDEDHLERLLNLSELDGIDLVEWFPRGIPVIDDVGGIFRAGRKQAPALITSILELEALRIHIDVFPYGIPNPEGFMVKFRTP